MKRLLRQNYSIRKANSEILLKGPNLIVVGVFEWGFYFSLADLWQVNYYIPQSFFY